MSIILDWDKYAKKARQAASEGIVLLKNDNDILPLKKQTKVSIFGRIQYNYIKSGTGSGGMVNTPYIVDIKTALKDELAINENLDNIYQEWLKDNPFDYGTGWAQEPWCQTEMTLNEKIVQDAASYSDIAIVVIGRLAGEDKDNSATKGSYLLTDEEERMLKLVSDNFKSTIVLLNVGNIIDMKFINKCSVDALMYVWQGGAEGGNGVKDILMGYTSPSGKLSDTIAFDIEDYPSTKNYGHEKTNIYEEDIFVGYRYFETFAPEKVLYPFGFGLSYAKFKIELLNFTYDNNYNFEVKVENISAVSGKEVIQLYVNPPQNKLKKPLRNLIYFDKTKELKPNESQVFKFSVTPYELSSFDDEISAYILESGKYEFYLGGDVRSSELVCLHEVNKTQIIEQLTQRCAPIVDFKVLTPSFENNVVSHSYENVIKRNDSYVKYEYDNKLVELPYTGNKNYTLLDVKENKITLDDYLAQIDDDNLIYLSRGEGMCSPKVTTGTAGCFGGVSPDLLAVKMPIACCADGPSGLRLDSGDIAFSIPNGTLLGCTFNKELNNELFEFVAKELRLNNVDTLLGPGMNIHRNPLNGRNFEYFSEDPILTGDIATAQLNGMKKYQVYGTIKHFACNNQEFKRTETDSLVSQRALREIYLKGFERAVKANSTMSIMTTYGLLNGLYTAGNYDLNTSILREEWGFDGIVMTDWWAKMNEENEEGNHQNTTLMIKAQNDLNMVNANAVANSLNDNNKEGLTNNIITRKHLIRNAKNICNFMLNSNVLNRFYNLEYDKVEQVNKYEVAERNSTTLNDVEATIDGTVVDLTNVKAIKNSSIEFNVDTTEKGMYSLKFKLSSQINNEAQLSMSIFNNNQIVKTITLNRANQNIEEVVNFVAHVSINSFIKIYFSETGINIDELIVYKKEVANV